MGTPTSAPSTARRTSWPAVGIVLFVAAIGAVMATAYGRKGADGDPVSLPAAAVVFVVLLAGTWWATRWAWMPLVMLIPAGWVAISGPLAVSDNGDDAGSLVLALVLEIVGLLVVLGCCWYAMREGRRAGAPRAMPYEPPVWAPGQGPGPGPAQAMSFPSAGGGAPRMPNSAAAGSSPRPRPTGATAGLGDQPQFRPMDPLGAHLLMENQRKTPGGPPPAGPSVPPADARRSRHAPPRPTRYPPG